MSETTDVLTAIDNLRRELSGYHGQLKAHNDLQRHCDNQRQRIAELEGLHARDTYTIANLREELVRWEAMAEGIELPEYPITEFKPKDRDAALGRSKAKSHPYGYEPDTGAFDVTRCECGCLNDISATYCNDCGGEIEVDMNAEKEIYHTPRHSVFATKHDDGSLELDGKRYVAATLVSGTLEAENAKLRELVDELYPLAEYGVSDVSELDKAHELMRELGIEVG